ncbi:uncharacterized protein LOC111412708 [Olea europaea var. sylvestris]|uniref:uncharacterized protein LOC111412708 n=1 Tax=Olea europaea var. sylvestris TaxID=158386 RepID=UPI000C1D0F5C|nr:uncharacterized protein LOC111412708 [Olea europaea var. sylvestris]
MPSYAKFMKDILSNKRKLEDNEIVMLAEECSAILQHKLPLKLKDPRSFTIPCNIGNLYIDKALCDLGTRINLIPLSLFRKLVLGEAKSSTVSLQLANRSIKHPRGISEDILVKVGKFIFPADFIILDMEKDRDVPLILGHPFLATERALIDVQKGQLILMLNKEEVIINVFRAFKFQSEPDSCMQIDDLSSENEKAEECARYLATIPPFFKQPRLELGERPTTPLPSIQQTLELEEDQLLRVLREHKTAI